VKSDADPDYDEGKAVAFVASRVHPRSKKNVTYLVQIRRFRENVGPIPVGNCLDMMQELSLENSIFFVSSSFTEAALNIVQRDNRVQLIDRTGLVKVLRKIIK
jgi:HJR/Mrr/RecB family endonuclease